VPAGLDRDGLPIWVQFYGDFGREDQLLRLAAQFERARPEWFGGVPPAHVTRSP
jgi:Asp-tRNA(Asn)/Glu-tRNA(Gln) amidotransferase A subunit family amidase